jgi:hypothetical protein
MKKKWLSLIPCCCVLIVIFSHWTASAEFYQYTDQNGHFIFTDDLSRVPVDQRDEITTYNSAKPVDLSPDATGDSPLQETNPADKISVQRDALEKESFRLQQARKSLMEEKKKVTTLAEQQAYNEKVTRLNQQIEQFSQQLESFNKTVSGDYGDPGAE